MPPSICNFQFTIFNLQFRATLASVLLLVCGCAREEQHALAGGREIESWLEEIRDPSPRARRQAVQKLGNVGDEDPAVAQALCEALQDSDAQVRREAVFAVVKLAEPGSEITSRLGTMSEKDADPGVRDVAARALAKLSADTRGSKRAR